MVNEKQFISLSVPWNLCLRGLLQFPATENELILLFLVNAWEVASSFQNLLMQDTYPQSIALHKRQFYLRILNLPEALLSQPQNSKSLEKK